MVEEQKIQRAGVEPVGREHVERVSAVADRPDHARDPVGHSGMCQMRRAMSALVGENSTENTRATGAARAMRIAPYPQ
ncbi:hypothetical protein BN970_04171 [Mycolicibacterium conceptionense]|uniref:Uncharacterized protein n=1 Tax=Mycolicibacterium conceptionense TaxID=451644 RepID=A0A0U1DLB3_9MYCO|nr:hypothetical protein BN970_04171 [Mycolicibacterium conceptionense]